MITKKNIRANAISLEIMDNHRKYYENQQITSILKYFGIPENKSENIKSISDYLNLILFQSLRQVLYLKLLIF
jgi:hypothetical protein